MSHILLHTCCAPCASASAERLLQEGYKVTLFFSNSNIFPGEEFEKRRKYVYMLAEMYNIPVIDDDYDHKAWLNTVKGLEKEPEKGKRCPVCFDFSFFRTSEKAKELNIPHFTTTLTISPHKNSRVIQEIGSNYDNYLHLDFKKQDGFKRSTELSRKFGLYRQDYCGCEFSIVQPG